MTDAQLQPDLTVLAWTPKTGPALRGFADIQLRNGLRIFGVGVFCANGRTWANMPAKPIIGADGVAQRDSATNKIRYTPVVEWSDRQTSARFSAAVLAALEAKHPGVVTP